LKQLLIALALHLLLTSSPTTMTMQRHHLEGQSWPRGQDDVVDSNLLVLVVPW